MPQISVNDLARLRQIRQWSQLYAVVHVPNTLMTGTINDATIERGEMDIVFDNGAAGDGYTQALFDALDENTTLWIGSYPGGRDIGVIRVRSITQYPWPPVTGVINVAENDGILFADDLYLTVLDEHRIWPMFPRVDVDEDTDPATITWWKDYDIVHDWQTHQEPPVVIMGPPACIFIDPTSGLATENFWGNDSYSPRGTGLTGAILWTFPHGTPATQNTLGTEAAPHAVTWDTPGVYTVKLSITDANGRVSVGYRLVFVFDRSGANAPHQNFEIRNMRGNFSSGGWSANIRFFGDRVYGEEYDVDDFPEGTQVVVFAEDWYNGELISIGGYGHREEIVFVGWIKSDTIRKEPVTGEVSFQIHSVDGELRNCPGFPQTVERVTGVPASWLEIQNMTLDLVGFYMGYWHSTLYEVVDVLESGDTSKVKYVDVTQTNLYSLLDKGVFNSTIFTRALSDRQSRFKYDSNPQYLTDDVKPVTIMDLDPEDWLGRVDVQEIHENKISWVDLSGVRVTDAEEQAAVFSLAPGDVPAPDGAFKQFTRLVMDDQDDGNFLAGRALADKNNPLPRTRVPLQGNYRIFDIQPQEWVTLDSLETLREGLGLGHETGTPWPTGTRFIPRDIDIGFRNDFGAFMISMNMEAEVSGVTGTAGYYPEDPPTPDPPIPPDPPEPPEPTPSNGADVVVILDMAAGRDEIWVSQNYRDAAPNWSLRMNGLPTTLAVHSIKIDAYNTGRTGACYAVICTSDGIWRNTNLFALSSTWTQVLDDAQILTDCYGGAGTISAYNVRDLVFDSTTSGWAYMVVNVNHSTDAGAESANGRLWGYRTTTYGATWTFVVAIQSDAGGGPDPERTYANADPGCLAISPANPNYIYLRTRKVAGADHYWLRTTDKGATWGYRAQCGGANLGCGDGLRLGMRDPWADIDDVYSHWYGDAIAISTDGCSTNPALISLPGLGYGGNFYGLARSPLYPEEVFCFTQITAPDVTPRLFKTTTGAAPWTIRTLPADPWTANSWPIKINGEIILYMGRDGEGVYLSETSGDLWNNKDGDLFTLADAVTRVKQIQPLSF